MTTDSRHARMSPLAEAAYREVAALVPPDAAIVVESPVDAGEVEAELERVRSIFCAAAVP